MNKFVLKIVLFLFSGALVAQSNQYPDTLNKKRLATVIATESVFYVSGISFLSFWWYKDAQRVPFQWYNDNAGYLQIDKFGHALTAYKQSYFGYYELRKCGVSKNKALIYGGPLGLILQTPIEVFDGMYEGWGFSKGDMWANAAGSALVVAQELLWNDQIIKLKMSYQRSKYAAIAPELLGKNQLESFLFDYNGHTYWLSTNINKIIPSAKIPNWLNFAIGYSANGMFGEFENYRFYGGNFIPEHQRYRQFLFSLDIDWTKIQTQNKVLKKLFNSMLILKLPFPALEYNPHNGFVSHWLYF